MTNKLKGSEDNAPWSTLVPTGPILRPAEAARYVGLSLATYYKHAARGLLPSPLKLGERAAGVPTNWLDAVIAKRATAAEAHA